MAPDGDEHEELEPQDPPQHEHDELEPQDPELEPQDPELEPQDPELEPQDPELEPQDPGQRERELEEVRRSFTEVGRRLGTLGQQHRFATVLPVATRPGAPGDSADDTGADDTGADDTRADADTDEAGRAPALPGAALQLPTVEPPPRRRPRWPVAALALGLIFTVGLLLGRTLDRSSPAASRATPVPSSTIAKTVPRTVTPPSCLAAVLQADQSIDYLVRKVRDQRLRDTLNSFTKESRACQRAGPTAASSG